jgi:hypothetical protein
MGGWDAPTYGGATEAGASERRRCRMKPIVVTARAITATPPTTPPTIAAVFELLFDVGEEVGFKVEEGSLKSDDVAPLRVPDAGFVAPDAGFVAPEAPSIAPGACSGVSKSPYVGVRH